MCMNTALEQGGFFTGFCVWTWRLPKAYSSLNLLANCGDVSPPDEVFQTVLGRNSQVRDSALTIFGHRSLAWIALCSSQRSKQVTQQILSFSRYERHSRCPLSSLSKSYVLVRSHHPSRVTVLPRIPIRYFWVTVPHRFIPCSSNWHRDWSQTGSRIKVHTNIKPASIRRCGMDTHIYRRTAKPR